MILICLTSVISSWNMCIKILIKTSVSRLSLSIIATVLMNDYKIFLRFFPLVELLLWERYCFCKFFMRVTKSWGAHMYLCLYTLEICSFSPSMVDCYACYTPEFHMRTQRRVSILSTGIFFPPPLYMKQSLLYLT